MKHPKPDLKTLDSLPQFSFLLWRRWSTPHVYYASDSFPAAVSNVKALAMLLQQHRYSCKLHAAPDLAATYCCCMQRPSLWRLPSPAFSDQFSFIFQNQISKNIESNFFLIARTRKEQNRLLIILKYSKQFLKNTNLTLMPLLGIYFIIHSIK